MSQDGFIFMHRRLLDSRVFQNEGLLKVWLWCLLRAGYQERWVPVKTGSGETEVFLRPGQFIFGRKTAAKELKMNPSTVNDRIQKLKKIGNIDTQPGTHYTIISIVNWHTYQELTKNSDTQAVRQATTKQQPADTNNKVNKVNNITSGKFFIDFFIQEPNGWNLSDIEKAIDGIISTRKNNKIAESVLRKELEYWLNFLPQIINAALKIYVDGRHWEKGKDEKYLRGIIRYKDEQVQKENNKTLFQKAF